MDPPHPLSTKRTRIVCVSDTHNASPLDGTFKLPKGDVLIHAGDMTNQGSISELRKTLKWIENADFELKIVIAGNHDITLDPEFYAEYGSYFHNQNPQNPSECSALISSSPSITYLNHQSARVRLTKPDGPQTTFKIFGSPYSPARGLWAFGYKAEEAAGLWDQIPLDADIVVTHTPPKYHCDESPSPRGSSGCEKLRETLWRVRPRLAVCGHIHEGRGSEWVRWDLSVPDIKFKEMAVVYGTSELWTQKETGPQQSGVIDVTDKSGHALDNDGSVGEWAAAGKIPDPQGSGATLQTSSLLFDASSRQFHSSKLPLVPQYAVTRPSHHHHPLEYHFCETRSAPETMVESIPQASHGRGGTSPSAGCDLEALSERMGRKETLVVNAAIAATSWPHKGGKKYNPPIVVDMDLPICSGGPI